MGKTIGLILIVAGLAWCGLVSAFVYAGSSSGQVETQGGMILGIGLFGIVPMLIICGAGMFMFISGSREAAEMADVRKKERLLGMIQTAGKISIGSAAIEMRMTQQQIKDAIFELTNQGLFSGFINWQEGIFYGKDAANVGSNKCPNCGGIREIVGKGLVKCPYCSVELFVPPVAPQTRATPAAPGA